MGPLETIWTEACQWYDGKFPNTGRTIVWGDLAHKTWVEQLPRVQETDPVKAREAQELLAKLSLLTAAKAWAELRERAQ